MTEDPLIRPLVFGLLFVLFAVCENFAPRRDRTLVRIGRWLGNLGILAVGTLLARILLPVAPVGAAIWAQGAGYGLFNALAVPALFAGILSFLTLDLLIYWQHRIFHDVPQLWRLHRMHHTDMDLDVSSGLRFHPLEILLSLAIKCVAVVVLGAPAAAVVIFEIVLNGTSMFNHANFALPTKVDATLRLFVVTPDMHRVHHSVRPEETNSNFGFNIPIWDRIFRTYTATPKDGHTGMTIGLPVFRDRRAVGLWYLIIQPFLSDRAATPHGKGGGDKSPPP